MLEHVTRVGINQEVGGRLAMIDSGSSADFKPSKYIKSLSRNKLDYLSITKADQDHMYDLNGLEDAGVTVDTLRPRANSKTGCGSARLRQCGPQRRFDG
jgi:hypothetical protein